MVRSVAGNLPEQVKNNQSVNTAAGNGGQKMSQYSWFTVYKKTAGNIMFYAYILTQVPDSSYKKFIMFIYYKKYSPPCSRTYHD